MRWPVPGNLDLSRAICRVCGEGTLLAAEATPVADELSSFSVQHMHDAAFCVDVVVAGPDELSEVDSAPFQLQAMRAFSRQRSSTRGLPSMCTTRRSRRFHKNW